MSIHLHRYPQNSLREQISTLGFTPQWRAYPMAHQVCFEQITEIGRWLAECLAPV